MPETARRRKETMHMTPHSWPRIRYHMTVEEYLGACAQWWNLSGRGIPKRLVWSAFLVSCGIVFWVIVSPYLAVPVLLWGAFEAAWVAGRYIACRESFLRSPEYFKEIRLFFDDRIVRQESAAGTLEIKWACYNRYLILPKHILLFQDKNRFMVIPKSAFPDSETLNYFLELARGRTPAPEWPGTRGRQDFAQAA